MRSTIFCVVAGSSFGLPIGGLQRARAGVDAGGPGEVGPADASDIHELWRQLHREAPAPQLGGGDELAAGATERLVDHLARGGVVADGPLEDGQRLLRIVAHPDAGLERRAALD